MLVNNKWAKDFEDKIEKQSCTAISYEKRVKINSIKEKDAKSAMCTIKIKAKTSLYRFRFDTENNTGKESVLKRLNEIIENNVLPQAVEVLMENNSNESI